MPLINFYRVEEENGGILDFLCESDGSRHISANSGEEAGKVDKAITAGATHQTWRSVKGDRLGSGLSPIYFLYLSRTFPSLERRPGLPSTARVN